MTVPEKVQLKILIDDLKAERKRIPFWKFRKRYELSNIINQHEYLYQVYYGSNR